jgi:hypothetical protein
VGFVSLSKLILGYLTHLKICPTQSLQNPYLLIVNTHFPMLLVVITETSIKTALLINLRSDQNIYTQMLHFVFLV